MTLNFPKRLLLSGILIGLITACATAPVPAPEPVSVEVPAPIAEANTAVIIAEAQSRPESLEVAPLENPAIALLVEQAEAAAAQGELANASILLERALRIEPYNPRLWQRLAEVRVAQQRYFEAEEMAMRSFGQSARVGEWCRRNWLTLRETRRAMGDSVESDKAALRAEECVLAPPPRY